MARTDGHGNPDWTKDETLLALDLYFRFGSIVPGPDDPTVVLLSEELRGFPIHSLEKRRSSFRNAASVAFKLQNLRSVATGQGLSNVSAMDRFVWEHFGGDPASVHLLAQQIRVAVRQLSEKLTIVDWDSFESEFVEGRVLTYWHLRRERDPSLRRRLLAKRQLQGGLRCECCFEGPRSAEERWWDASFEAHHLLPLAQMGQGITQLADLALLCANCHRLIHAAMKSHRRLVDIAELRSLLT